MRLAVAAIALLSAGCATVPSGRSIVEESSRALAQASQCCETLATARRAALPLQPAEVMLDKTAQAFDFGGNKAFFVLYELPPFEQPYSVVVTSVAGGSLSDVALFIPRIAAFDGDFKPTRYYDEKTLRNRGNNLERTVFINPSNRAERYLAIYGSDLSASIERPYSMVTVTPVVAGPLIFNVYGGQDGTSTLQSSPTGKLKLETQGLGPVPAAR